MRRRELRWRHVRAAVHCRRAGWLAQWSGRRSWVLRGHRGARSRGGPVAGGKTEVRSGGSVAVICKRPRRQWGQSRTSIPVKRSIACGADSMG